MPATNPLVIGIGEILWDLLPSGKQLGGAPANFAYHAHALGAQGVAVSAVGDDDLGREINTRLQKLQVETRYLQINRRYPTGTVGVTLESGKPTYIIHENVAWDFINWEDELTELALAADAVCLGSLAQRSFVSRSTIHAFLQHTRPDCLRIFDLNLRQSYYSPQIIDTTLQLCNVFKLNDEEWPVVAKLFDLEPDAPQGVRELISRYNLQLVALTQGAEGSLLITADDVHHQPITATEVVDTIGAGDSFAAALAMGLLRHQPLAQVHAHATAVAAYVCSRPGATPPLPRDLVQAASATPSV
jgi:fructokinase